MLNGARGSECTKEGFFSKSWFLSMGRLQAIGCRTPSLRGAVALIASLLFALWGQGLKLGSAAGDTDVLRLNVLRLTALS